MKTKYTPAPWLYDDGHIFTENIHGFNSKYNSIATIHDIYSDNGKPQENINLIKNAPLLLETCQEALWLLKNNDLIEAMEYLELIIKKVIT